MHITKTVRENAEVVLSGTIPRSSVEAWYEKAVAQAIAQVAVPGFRKGHVPRERVIEEVGEGFLWKDAAERALKDELDEILKKEALIPLVPLTLSFKKSTPREDVEFEVVVVVPPACEPFNAKFVAEKALEALPQEDQTTAKQEAVRAFRMQVRAISKMSSPEAVKEGDAKENEAKADTPLSDEEAKAVGFENTDAAEFFIAGEAEKAVTERMDQKKRSVVAEALIAASSCQIPTVLVNEEAGGLLETFKRDVAAQNLTWSDYLKRIGKNETQVREDLRPSAVKRITLDLVFGMVIREHKLELTEEDKKQEEAFAHKLVEQGVDHQRAHGYARESLLREKVWETLGVGAKKESTVS